MVIGIEHNILFLFLEFNEIFELGKSLQIQTHLIGFKLTDWVDVNEVPFDVIVCCENPNIFKQVDVFKNENPY